MAKKAKRKAQFTKRIYYGPEGAETSVYWTVKVSHAKAPVLINGAVMHALRGHAGVTIGCGLSNAAVDNADAFPHPVYFASFTKSTALIVDRLRKNGEPMHAVLYRHNYRHITDANDARTLKKMVTEDPSVMEREFVLHVPHSRVGSGEPVGKTGAGTNKGKSFIPRGALARAVRAGRIGAHVAQQISDVAKRSSKKNDAA